MKSAKDNADAILSKLTIKAVTKAVKVSKVFLVLKWTKRLKSLKEKEPEDAVHVQEAVEALQQAKSINHVELGRAIAEEQYPHIFGTGRSSVPADPMAQQIISSKQFQQAVDGLEESLKKVVEKKNRGTLRKAKSESSHPTAHKPQQPQPLGKPASLVGHSKAATKKISLSKAMFVESLSSDQVVVTAAGDEEDDEQKEAKRQKSLRNQRNRILNKLKRDQHLEDMNKYLPVHLRHLPEPERKGKRASDQQPKHIQQQDSSSRPSSSRGDGDDRKAKRRGGDEDGSSSRGSKKPRYEAPVHTPAPAPAAPVSVDSKLITQGKDWQAAGVHPSWAAKQMKKESALVIPMGGEASKAKKIVFDD